MKFELTYLLCCSKNDDAIIFSFPGQMKTLKRPKRSVSIHKGLLALAAKLSQDKKNQRRHALKNILKYFFVKTACRLLQKLRKKMALQNMLFANIIY